MQSPDDAKKYYLLATPQKMFCLNLIRNPNCVIPKIIRSPTSVVGI